MITCNFCDAVIDNPNPRQKFCNHLCYERSLPVKKPSERTKKCTRCEREFRTISPHLRLCPDCKENDWRADLAEREAERVKWRAKLVPCPRCNESRFRWNPNQDTSEQYPQGVCDQCHKLYEEPFRHGLSRGIAEDMLLGQGGKCAICTRTILIVSRASRVDSVHVDHDHSCCPGNQSCGRCVRGLLCGRCNLALGLLRDDADLADSAAKYLRQHSKVNVAVGL